MKKSLLLFVSTVSSTLLLAQTWTTVTPNTTGTATGLTVHNNALFISTQAASPHKSTDGSNWNKKDNGITPGVEPQGGGVGSAGSYVYYAAKGGNGIFRSGDDGDTWDTAGTGVTVSAFNFGRFFYEFNGVYYCSMSGAVSQGGGLLRSTDGTSWTPVTLGGSNGEAAYTMTQIGSKIYVCTNMSFYESSDDGVSWTAVSTNGAKVYNGLFENNGRRLVHTTFGMEFSDDNGASWDTLTSSIKSSTYCGFRKGAGDTIYSYSASSGVFYSTDNGDSWVDITGDLSTNDVKFMNGMEYFNGKLYLATLLAVKSNGTGTSTPTGITETAINNNWNIYPNPSNGIFTINDLENNIRSVEVYDITGALVKSIANNSTQLTFEVEKSGVYLVRANFNNGLKTVRKITKY